MIRKSYRLRLRGTAFLVGLGLLVSYRVGVAEKFSDWSSAISRDGHWLFSVSNGLGDQGGDSLEPIGGRTSPPSGAVHALFDLTHPKTGPFPTDIFTVVDATHNTGRRVNLPYPDCAVRCL
jgi:hypothetical protein